jgi:hypothetical protein
MCPLFEIEVLYRISIFQLKGDFFLVLTKATNPLSQPKRIVLSLISTFTALHFALNRRLQRRNQGSLTPETMHSYFDLEATIEGLLSPKTQYCPRKPHSQTSSGPRRRSGKSKTPEHCKGYDSRPTLSQGSLISDLRSDLHVLPRATYPYWKWVPFLYILWLLFTCTQSKKWSLFVQYHGSDKSFHYAPSATEHLQNHSTPRKCHPLKNG